MAPLNWDNIEIIAEDESIVRITDWSRVEIVSEDGDLIKTCDNDVYNIEACDRMIVFSGQPGADGPQGPAATIQVGTVTTLPAGSDATVTNSGTPEAAIFDFGIPKGADGASEWGDIGGTLSDQTDLQNALNAKANTADLGDLATKDSVDYETEVTNKPTLGTMSAESASDYYNKSATDALLQDKADIILSSASGSIASFSDGGAYPVTAFSVGIEPVQSGSGTPSPDNIRPISGHTECNIYHEAEYDAEATPKVTIDLDGTRYGGKLNVLTGLLTVDRWVFEPTEPNYTNSTDNANYKRARFNVPEGYSIKNNADNTELNPEVVCNRFKTITSQATYRRTEEGISDGYTFDSVYIFKADLKTIVQWREWIANNPLQIVYPLATPFTVQLSPAQLSTLLGENNIWASTGQTNVTYRADTKLFIEEQIADTAKVTRQMIADSATADGKAPKSLATGDLIIVGDELRKATDNIGQGSAITASNSTTATLADVIKALQ